MMTSGATSQRESASDDPLIILARRIKAAQDCNATLAFVTTSGVSPDIRSAYAVADHVYRMRLAEGAIPAGRKIGFTNRNIWDEYGVHQPIWGWMYEHTVVRAVNGQARLAASRYAEPKIEPEIVFHFASAPPARAGVVELLACIDWVAHGIEIVQSHFPDWKFGVADTVADGGLHAALVLGEPVPLRALGADPVAALAAIELDLVRNGDMLETGRGIHVLGNPLNALAHLSDVLPGLPNIPVLAAGEIVTTGTLTAAHTIVPGQRWRTIPRGLPLQGLVVEIDP